MVVCLVENNHLADCYLRQILTKAGNVRLISEDALYTNNPTLTNAEILFLIDADTLGRALSTYLRSLRSRVLDPKVLVLGQDRPSDDLRRLLLLGVEGFLLYNDVERDLAIAIKSIRDGKLWVPSGIISQFVRESARMSQSKTESHREFTERENLVIGLLKRRFSNKEIGSALNISEGTVKFHLSNIFAKLGVHDRQSVVEMNFMGAHIGAQEAT
jgi:DNA-binding NarL/FixJ family response regulator